LHPFLHPFIRESVGNNVRYPGGPGYFGDGAEITEPTAFGQRDKKHLDGQRASLSRDFRTILLETAVRNSSLLPDISTFSFALVMPV